MSNFTLPRPTYELILDKFKDKESAEKFAIGVEHCIDVYRKRITCKNN